MAFQEFLKDLKKDLKEDGVKETAVELHDEYGIDQQEFGKIVIIASLALFIASVPSALTLQETHDELKQTNENFDPIQGILDSDRFQENLDTLDSRVEGQLGNSISQIVNTLEDTRSDMERLEETEKQLQDRANTYKWLSLISILGMVSGVVIIYI